MIFLDNPNRYGYLLDLKDPFVRKMYDRYRKKLGIPHGCPLSDAQRVDFETTLIDWLNERRGLDEQQGKGKAGRA